MREDKSSNFILFILIIVLIYFIFFYMVPSENDEILSFYDSLGQYKYNNENVNVKENITEETIKHDTNTPSSGGNLRFYYNQLSQSQKKIYDAIVSAFNKHNNIIKLNNANVDDMKIATYAVSSDHPEFFWVREYTYNTKKDDRVVSITYDIPSDANVLMQRIDQKATRIVDDANFLYDDDYYKLEYFYKWIIDNTDYGETEDSQEITSVFINHTSVCAGYSKAFMYLCQKAGIECIYVSGYTENNQNHAWNMVKLGDNYYWVDTTLGDPIFVGNNIKSINYNFFMVDDEELFENHVLSSVIDMANSDDVDMPFVFPQCNDNSLNYYRLNGVYFDNYDKYEMAEYLKKKFANNEYSDLEIKFRYSYQFDNFVKDYLSDSKGMIFDVIKSANPFYYGTVSVSCETIENSNYIKLNIKLKE